MKDSEWLAAQLEIIAQIKYIVFLSDLNEGPGLEVLFFSIGDGNDTPIYLLKPTLELFFLTRVLPVRHKKIM